MLETGNFFDAPLYVHHAPVRLLAFFQEQASPSVFSSPQVRQSLSFCCSMSDVEKNVCHDVNRVKIPGAYTFDVNAETLKVGAFGPGSTTRPFRPRKSGIYYVAFSNCAPLPTNAEEGKRSSGSYRFLSGELQAVSEIGYLPGEEVGKLYFYPTLAAAYLGILLIWVFWCRAWRDVLFKIHHYITVVIVVGLVEAVCW